MDGARLAPGFLAGVVLLDILVDLPGFSPAAPVASLLSPSLDLLIVLAVLMSAARGGPGLRAGFAAAVAAFMGLSIGLRAYLRWGAPEATRFLAAGAVFPIVLLGLAAVIAAALAGIASFLLSRLLYRGLAHAVLRSLFLLVAACCAVIQALAGVRIFAPSSVPGILRAIGEIVS